MKTFIIAEAGVNHNGDLELAKKLIDVAVAAGADAVKFQTFRAELLVTKTATQADYQTRNIGKAESQFDMLKRLELPRPWHPILQSYAKERGIIFISTPFAKDDADFLESINIPMFKIPSGEITNLPYLRHIAKKGKKMIISTGMATMVEVKEAVRVVRAQGNEQIIVLHSTSNYPPSLQSLNLSAILTLQHELQIPIGYSDNGSPGYVADVIAVALGACVVEKHFTIDKNLPGPDHLASLDPIELKAMVQAIRDTEIMLGSGEKIPTTEEAPIAAVARKSIVAAKDIKAGEVFTEENLTVKRPGTGISPMQWDIVIGTPAKRDFKADELIER